MKYVPRVLEKMLKRYLKSFPVVGVTGPRQSGKSTLLLNVTKKYRYVTFDDPMVINHFESDPEGFMNIYDNHVIFDEVQHVPKIFNYIKLAVDRDRQNYGKYIITGSSQFAFLRETSESLAGRIGLLTLLPFQYAEIPKAKSSDAIYKGSYPELVINNYRESYGWFGAYLDTYINKDIRTISNIGAIRDFRRFVNLLAVNASQMLNMSNYAKDLGVTVPTIKHWISVLEASYIIFLLPPYYKNFGKRLIKSPKIYFYDTGLISYLTGIETQSQFEKGPMAGSIFENYIVSEVFKKECHSKTNAELFYLRTSNKVEIDLIVDRKQSREFIEIKKTATCKVKMLDAVRQFVGPNDKGYLLYNGRKQQYAENLEALNYKAYLGGGSVAKT